MKTLRQVLAAAVLAIVAFGGTTLAGPAVNSDSGVKADPTPIKGPQLYYIEGDFPGTCGETCDSGCDCWTDDDG